MTDPDTQTSVQGDTPSGQEAATDRYPAETGGGASAATGDGSGSSAEKPTTDWVTGDEPMTGPQASYLATLAQQAGEEAPTGLTKSQASRAIDDLRSKAR